MKSVLVHENFPHTRSKLARTVSNTLARLQELLYSLSIITNTSHDQASAIHSRASVLRGLCLLDGLLRYFCERCNMALTNVPSYWMLTAILFAMGCSTNGTHGTSAPMAPVHPWHQCTHGTSAPMAPVHPWHSEARVRYAHAQLIVPVNSSVRCIAFTISCA